MPQTHCILINQTICQNSKCYREKKWVRIGDTSMQIYKWIPLKAEEQPTDPDRNQPIIDPILDNNHQSNPATILNNTSNNINNSITSKDTNTSQAQSSFLEPLTHDNNNRIPNSTTTTTPTVATTIQNSTKDLSQNDNKMVDRKHARDDVDDHDPNNSLELPPSKRIRFNNDNDSFSSNLNNVTNDDAMMTDNDNEVRQYDELQQVNRNSLPFSGSNISSNGTNVMQPLTSIAENNNQSQILSSENPSNITSVSATVKSAEDESLSMSLMDVSNTNLEFYSSGDQLKDIDDFSSIARMVTNQLVDHVSSPNQGGMLH